MVKDALKIGVNHPIFRKGVQKKLKEPLLEPNSFLAPGRKIDEVAFFSGSLRTP
jgi:hypothetical protein